MDRLCVNFWRTEHLGATTGFTLEGVDQFCNKIPQNQNVLGKKNVCFVVLRVCHVNSNTRKFLLDGYFRRGSEPSNPSVLSVFPCTPLFI